MAQTTLVHSHWHESIEQQVKTSFFHDQTWLDLIARRYGYTLHLLTTTNSQGQITGILPLFFMHSPLTGRRLVSLPFSDFCSLISTDEASTNDLVDQAIALAKKRNVRYLELRSGSNATLAQRSDLVASNLYVRWLLPLTSDPDALWAGLRKPVQRQIKKAQNQDIQVRNAQQRTDMQLYYQLHLKTRSKHGMPAQSLSFFYDLWDTYQSQEHVQLLLADYQGSTIAGMILLASGDTVRYAYGASDEQYLNLAPNNLLLWKAMTWGSTNGYQTLDLGRTACDNQGLMEFKRRWGATKEELPYYYYPQMAGLTATSENSTKYQLMTSWWKRLPLQIAGPLGGYLYKHLG